MKYVTEEAVKILNLFSSAHVLKGPSFVIMCKGVYDMG